ncbi:MAG: PilZ domain-containing protein [Deltaproteobacteria bacterium]|nr:PilZ domain-containing protein [Deltaproteobacteria bacterium]
MTLQNEVPVALIAPRGPDADCYQRHLVRHGAAVSTYPALADFQEGCAGLLFSGLAVDLGSLAGLAEDERAFVAGLVDSFAFVRLRRVGPPEEIAGTFQGKAFAGEELLAPFLHEARSRRPRGVRLEDRHARVLSVFIYRSERDLGRPGTAASISNLSKGGFYVVTPEPAPKERCLLVVPELGDETPIPCEVRWSTPWGASTQVLPGFGVRCLSLTVRQKEMLTALLAGPELKG